VGEAGVEGSGVGVVVVSTSRRMTGPRSVGGGSGEPDSDPATYAATGTTKARRISTLVGRLMAPASARIVEGA
jgi:hypothetical protein